MKSALLLSLSCLLLPLSALASRSPSAGWQETEPDGKLFVSLDLLGTGTFDHGPRNDSEGNARAYRAAGFATDGDWHTNGGAGVRVGYLRQVLSGFDAGGSLGFVAGPSFEETFSASQGGASVAWTDQGSEVYARLMLESQWRRPLNANWTFHVQGAAGLSLGWQQDTFHCSATGTTCPRPIGDSTGFSPGIAWELGPAVSYKRWLLWMGIAGLPRAGGDDMVAVPAWRAFQLSLKYSL